MSNPFNQPPEQQWRGVTTNLARLLFDGWITFEGDSHEDRVNRIFAMLTMYDALLEAGQFEHTSDWDWFPRVKMKDGKEYVGDLSLEYEDTIPEDYTQRFARWKYLRVENLYDDESGETVGKIDVLIDDIEGILMDRA